MWNVINCNTRHVSLEGEAREGGGGGGDGGDLGSSGVSVGGEITK